VQFEFGFWNVKLFTVYQIVLFRSLKLFVIEIENYYYFISAAVA